MEGLPNVRQCDGRVRLGWGFKINVRDGQGFDGQQEQKKRLREQGRTVYVGLQRGSKNAEKGTVPRIKS